MQSASGGHEDLQTIFYLLHVPVSVNWYPKVAFATAFLGFRTPRGSPPNRKLALDRKSSNIFLVPAATSRGDSLAGRSTFQQQSHILLSTRSFCRADSYHLWAIVISSVAQPAQQQRAQIAAPIGNEVDHDFVAHDFVDHAVGLEKDLPVLGLSSRRQFLNTRAAMRQRRDALGRFVQPIEYIVSFLRRVVFRNPVLNLQEIAPSCIGDAYCVTHGSTETKRLLSTRAVSTCSVRRLRILAMTSSSG